MIRPHTRSSNSGFAINQFLIQLPEATCFRLFVAQKPLTQPYSAIGRQASAHDLLTEALQQFLALHEHM